MIKGVVGMGDNGDAAGIVNVLYVFFQAGIVDRYMTGAFGTAVIPEKEYVPAFFAIRVESGDFTVSGIRQDILDN